MSTGGSGWVSRWPVPEHSCRRRSPSGDARGACTVTPEELHERCARAARRERAVVAMLSGGRDSVCLLDVAVALRGPARRARAARQLRIARAGRYADERHCAELCERLGVELEVVRVGASGPPERRRRRQPAGVGARAALRGGDAGRPAERRAGRDGAHRQRPGRDDPLPAGGLAGPARAAGDGPRARGGWCARCWGSRASRRPPTAGARGLALARGREQRRRALRARARASAAACRRCARCTRRREANVLRTARAAARGDRAARRARRRELDGRASDRDRAPGGAARRRSRGWSWCASPRTPPGRYVPQAGERVDEILALGRARRATPSCTSAAARAP